MKKIYLSEDKMIRLGKLLKEARMDGFRIDNLRNMSYAARVKYCKQWLGMPIGNGSSRIVFQLDDDTVLKLAKNNKGIAQNEQEWRLSNDWYICNIFPEVYNGSDEDGFMWIVSEYVVPAKAEDFKRLLNATFKSFQQIGPDIIIHNNYKKWQNYEDKYPELFEFIHQLNDYANSYDAASGDLFRLCNWGLTKDNGGELKLLDYGLNDDIFDTYYKRLRR